MANIEKAQDLVFQIIERFEAGATYQQVQETLVVDIEKIIKDFTDSENDDFMSWIDCKAEQYYDPNGDFIYQTLSKIWGKWVREE